MVNIKANISSPKKLQRPNLSLSFFTPEKGDVIETSWKKVSVGYEVTNGKVRENYNICVIYGKNGDLDFGERLNGKREDIFEFAFHDFF